MTLELIAAVAVAAVVLWLVLAPLARSGARRGPDLDEIIPAEETRRGQALLALKEIDFDRATGKLSDPDHELLRDRYVSEALDVLRHEGRDPAEAMVAERARLLETRAVPGEQAVCPQCGPRPEADAVYCSSCGAGIGAPGACGACGAPVPPGSRYCPGCGARAGE